MARQPSSRDAAPRFAWEKFKVCDLCGALNHADRDECFVCRWHGHFTTDPETIHRAAQTPRVVTEEDQPLEPTDCRYVLSPTELPDFIARLIQSLRRLLRIK